MKSYAPRLMLGIIALLVAACEPSSSETDVPPTSGKFLAISDLNLAPVDQPNFIPRYLGAINSIIPETPYSALIVEEGIRVRPYVGPDDDYYKEVQTITGRVIETYRGEPLKYVEFEWATEGADDEPTTRDHPYIITLCKSGDIYYRQEIAADISATPETVAAARELAKTLDQAQTSFSDCE